jgi:hypothetical protein
MSRWTLAAVGAAGLVAGFAAGAYAISRGVQDTLKLEGAVYLVGDSAEEAGAALQVLELLQDGKYEAAKERLETGLDGDVVTLGPFANGDAELRRQALAAIEKVRRYRARHPRQYPDAEVRERVERVLGAGSP